MKQIPVWRGLPFIPTAEEMPHVIAALWKFAATPPNVVLSPWEPQGVSVARLLATEAIPVEVFECYGKPLRLTWVPGQRFDLSGFVVAPEFTENEVCRAVVACRDGIDWDRRVAALPFDPAEQLKRAAASGLVPVGQVTGTRLKRFEVIWARVNATGTPDTFAEGWEPFAVVADPSGTHWIYLRRKIRTGP